MKRSVLHLVGRGSLALVIQFGWPSSILFAQDGEAGAVAGVEIDLPGRFVAQRLPFDVPFQIYSEVPEGTEAIEVQYVTSKKPIQVTCRAGQCTLPDELWQPSDPLIWRAVPGVDSVPPTFRVTVPAIDAQRYVVFRISLRREVGPARAKTFRADARNLLDLRLRQIQDANLSSAETEAIRLDLSNALQEVAHADEIIAPRTIFDLETPIAEVRLDFLKLTTAVLQPQRQRVLALQDYAIGQPTLTARLESLRSHSALSKLIRYLDSLKVTNRSLAGSLEHFEDALRLTRMSSSEAVLWSMGYDPQDHTDPPHLSAIWDPADVETVIRGLGRLVRHLDAIREWLLTFTTPNDPNSGLLRSLVAAGGLSMAESAALRRLTESSGLLSRASEDADFLLGRSTTSRNALVRRDSALTALADELEISAVRAIVVSGSTTGNYETFQSWYISADAGLLYAFSIDRVIPYIGTNIYFRPVNKDALLSQKGGLGRRFALTIGLTVSSVADEDPQTRDDFFGGQALLLGAGLRATESLRIGGGALLFERIDPNPVISRRSLGIVGYVSVSFDWNIAKTFTGIGDVLDGP